MEQGQVNQKLTQRKMEDLNSRLPLKEWRGLLDRYLIEQKVDPNLYDMMDRDQTMIIQSLKKAFKRIKNKLEQ